MAADAAVFTDTLASAFLAGLAGALAGNFLTVAQHRLPHAQSIVAGRSHCPSCGLGLSLWQIFPLGGWMLLRGRCANCKTPIPLRYPLIEAVCTIGALLSFLLVPHSPLTAAGVFTLACVLITLALVPAVVRRPLTRLLVRDLFSLTCVIDILSSALFVLAAAVRYG